MTGALQNHSRKYALPIDTLQFTFRVLPQYERREVELAPADGVLIDGLFMDGARWDDEQQCMADSRLGELSARVPIIHFLPTDDPELAPGMQQGGEYQCPVYKTSLRAGVLSTTGQSTNFILACSLPIKNEESYWILKGAALLCQNE
jgi:dynein heavy chain